MKKILIALLLLMPFQTGAVTGNATVFNPETGDRKVVEIGSPSAFDGDYLLEVARAVAVPEGLLGFSVVTDYAKNLSASMNSTQSTVPVTSMSTKDEHTLTMADFGSKVFLVIEPGARKEEIVMCTGISGTNWIGCTRGLAFYGTSTTAVSANQMTHNSGSSVIISNTHYVYDESVDKDSTETIGGVKTFTSSPIVPSPTTATQAANKTYVDNVAQQGGATSTESVVGISQLATQLEMASSTHDSDNPAVLYSKYSTSSPQVAGNYVVVSEEDGNINQSWIDLTEDFSFSGDISVSGTTTLSGTVIGVNNIWFGDGSDGDVIISSNTSLTSDMFYDNLTINDGFVLSPSGYRIFVKDTLTFVGTGKIESNGKNGGNGGDGNNDTETFGAAGLAGAIAYTTDNSVLPYPLAGSAGGAGKYVKDADSAGGAGVAGLDMDKAINLNASGDGGAGGDGETSSSANGGVGGVNGVITYTNKDLLSIQDTVNYIDESDNAISILYPVVGSGGGGGGGAIGNFTLDEAASGGGGGSGSSGAYIQINAKTIVTVDGNVYVESIGGNGGNGGNGEAIAGTANASAGGGGGGAGGAGGILILSYQEKSGTGTVDLSGGTGGTGGTGDSDGSGSTANNGVAGGNGADGASYLFKI